MNTKENIKSVFEGWEIGELIGEGSYGKVYKAVQVGRVEMESAIKIITIPKSESELKSEGVVKYGFFRFGIRIPRGVYGCVELI